MKLAWSCLHSGQAAPRCAQFCVLRRELLPGALRLVPCDLGLPPPLIAVRDDSLQVRLQDLCGGASERQACS